MQGELEVPTGLGQKGNSLNGHRGWSSAFHWLFKAATATYFLYLASLIPRFSPMAPAFLGPALAISYAILAITILWRPFASEVQYDWKSVALCGASSFYYCLFDVQGPVSLRGAFAGEIFLALGTAGWIISASFLGRSFGILPALRKIQGGGPYRWVRHPMYASYLLLDLGLVICFPSLRNGTVVLLAAGLYSARAVIEERVLAGAPAYERYRQQTRFRFIPFVF